MKYRQEININLNRDKVVELFDSEENLSKWQEGLLGTKHLSGEKGQVGAQTEMHYKMGGREVKMIETITHRNLPEAFHGTYDAGNVFNIQENYFEALPNGNTKWITESEFQFKGIGKLIFPLMKGSFKKQSMKFMLDFKNFAESAS